MPTDSLKPARRSRTKLRKPKYLSLRLELSPQTSDTSASAAVAAKIQRDRRDRRKQKTRSQIKLPTLAPEIDPDDDENVVAADFLFNGDDTSATTLSSLLDSAATEMASSPVDSVGSVMESGCAPSSLFLRAAMKSSSRRGTDQLGEERVEKWVSYSKVVDRKPHDDELSSCGAGIDSAGGRQRRQQRVVEKKAGSLLCLKLDYEEVLNSWSDKGSLFIHGGGEFSHQQYDQEQPPQTVPDLSAESLARDSAINGQMDDGLENAVNLWAVPDVPKNDLTLENKHQSWFRQREASVLRYKEKRQNRLFAKRIRYQVRKLNAEKRPRVKGRFVRRGPEDDQDQKEDKIL